MNVILIGLKSAGKTTIGRLLATELQAAFVDTDELIMAHIQQEVALQKTIAMIYDELGSTQFRQLEQSIICRWHDQNTVLSTGGSSLLNKAVYQHLQPLGQLIYLSLSYPLWRARILAQDELPSFLRAPDQEAVLQQYYAQRDSLYQQLADKVVVIDGLSVQQVLVNVINTLNQ